MDEGPWKFDVEAFGEFLHEQRRLAQMSLRELSALSDLSNAYLSQLERGLHEPSMRAVSQIANAFNLSTEAMLKQAGLLAEDQAAGEPSAPAVSAEDAIRADPTLTEAQREALLAVYRSFGREA